MELETRRFYERAARLVADAAVVVGAAEFGVISYIRHRPWTPRSCRPHPKSSWGGKGLEFLAGILIGSA